MAKKIAIGGDHAGYAYKARLARRLSEAGYTVTDFGPASDDAVDYPDFAHPLATSIENKEHELGILICGSGNGVAIAANKHAAVRAAICWNSELGALARQHNDANVLCLPARYISFELAEEITDTFLKTAFEGGRHQRRVDKISC